MDQIVARTKDHEFRNYLILQKVERMWLYVASPRQILQYIAVISHGKSPGEIAVGSNGLGNADFNARLLKGNGGYAYEIKELYQLHGPVPLKEMQQKYGVTFPQRYIYVTNSMAKEIVLQDQIRIF
ncbi:hypothetical protein H0H87_007770 [Tephrocybe sp. NHM501043]|nr:hypothetical protein H0H87_007770 [Tephrocybe sp. NHM501043]